MEVSWKKNLKKNDLKIINCTEHALLSIKLDETPIDLKEILLMSADADPNKY